MKTTTYSHLFHPFCIALFFILLLLGASRAADVTLAWEDPQPGVVYRLEYARPVAAGLPVDTPLVWIVGATNIPKFVWNPEDVGPPPSPEYQQGTILNIAPGEYYFRCFAVEPQSGLDSLPSNTLRTTVNPSAPGQLRKKVALQESSDMKEWKDVFVEVSPVTEQSKFYRATVALVQ